MESQRAAERPAEPEPAMITEVFGGGLVFGDMMVMISLGCVVEDIYKA